MHYVPYKEDCKHFFLGSFWIAGQPRSGIPVLEEPFYKVPDRYLVFM